MVNVYHDFADFCCLHKSLLSRPIVVMTFVMFRPFHHRWSAVTRKWPGPAISFPHLVPGSPIINSFVHSSNPQPPPLEVDGNRQHQSSSNIAQFGKYLPTLQIINVTILGNINPNLASRILSLHTWHGYKWTGLRRHPFFPLALHVLLTCLRNLLYWCFSSFLPVKFLISLLVRFSCFFFLFRRSGQLFPWSLLHALNLMRLYRIISC